MTTEPIRFYFDFVDPVSYLMAREVEAAVGTTATIAWSGLELRPPPTPLTSIDDPTLTPRWEQARALASEAGVNFRPAALVPWTRKAHELMLHAEAVKGTEVDSLRRSIFEAYLLEGRDIGRVDVLVELARTARLDTTETKAVLDVDRYEADVAAVRMATLNAKITDTPVVVRGAQRLEGFHNGTALGTFLGT